jgi:hypothetical protein
MLDQLVSLLILVLVIALIWIVLKFILKLTAKVFSCGCLAIVVIGGLLILLRYLEVV